VCAHDLRSVEISDGAVSAITSRVSVNKSSILHCGRLPRAFILASPRSDGRTVWTSLKGGQWITVF
jgi:hypothetical protein